MHEIGVRMTLGAGRIEVVGLMIAMGGKLVAVGLVLGLAGALLAARLMETQLFGVRARDPLAFCSVALVLGAVALLACYLPARRAGAVDPLIALRHE